ncbi:GDSL-type esterase/lipase family protein [Brevibacterium litoralis]|uniref:GDSL-type esterase/lipase family protein n=1 Tax=Brevibacterium litoralis TaxID=3138935 RepID=UPI0032EC0FEC
MSHDRVPAIAVVGGAHVAGHGDARGLGWVGRVALRTLPALPAARFYPLGVPGEDSAGLGARCMPEASLRFGPDTEDHLVLAPGIADTESGLSTARSRLNLANVLDAALSAEVKTFVVGPPPTGDAALDSRVADLSASFADVALRRGITYVDTFTPLHEHEVWRAEITRSGTGLPGQEGYGLLAWLVLHRGWFDWLGITDPEA